jgi:hypothetical protein
MTTEIAKAKLAVAGSVDGEVRRYANYRAKGYVMVDRIIELVDSSVMVVKDGVAVTFRGVPYMLMAPYEGDDV